MLLLAAAACGLVVFLYSFYSIYRGVKANCLKAKSEYRQDCVSSLINFAQSENYTFRERNSAIWALGQIADKEALPFLYELNRSLPGEEKCSYDRYLCKYEVQKAIKWCERGNLTSWMYKNHKNWR